MALPSEGVPRNSLQQMTQTRAGTWAPPQNKGMYHGARACGSEFLSRQVYLRTSCWACPWESRPQIPAPSHPGSNKTPILSCTVDKEDSA